MIQLQILSYVLQNKSMDIIENNFLTEDYFTEYLEEFRFIQNHVREYKNVPDKATFLSRFSDIELVEVTETERYLIDTIREEHLYSQSVPMLHRMAELLKTDSNAAAEYMSSHIEQLQPNYGLGGTDIISQGEERLKQYRERRDNKDKWFFESGFKELDEIIHGIQREEEFLVIYARTNQGKSWVLGKICSHVWQTGFNVGYISPEMSANSIGFRFDTLFNHFSNKSLMWGSNDVDEDAYESYLKDLKQKQNKFIVATPSDFRGALTVSKLKQWIKQYKLDLIAIDGITYLTDERGKKGDNQSTTLTNISEDLMSLSIEMHVPVLAVVQANRTGVIQGEEDGTPELESIRGSDGISHNASKVLSIRQKGDSALEIGVKKQRFGAVGKSVNYSWDINTGQFIYVQSSDKPKQKQPRDTERKRDMEMF